MPRLEPWPTYQWIAMGLFLMGNTRGTIVLVSLTKTSDSMEQAPAKILVLNKNREEGTSERCGTQSFVLVLPTRWSGGQCGGRSRLRAL